MQQTWAIKYKIMTILGFKAGTGGKGPRLLEMTNGSRKKDISSDSMLHCEFEDK